MQVAVVGGGINGLCVGWELAKAGHAVSLFERDRIVSHTSQASSKLLHGGLRYLENGEFRLVREALLERRAWFEDAPALARPLQLTLPVYRGARRGKFKLGCGLALYDLLAFGSGLPSHDWLSREIVLARDASLKADGLLGAYTFWDGQMDDRALGLWVAEKARQAGTVIQEGAEVSSLDAEGYLILAGREKQRFDIVVNAAGPWASSLLEANGVATDYALDLVRGTHIVVDRACPAAYLLEVPGERRVFFVLPWQGKTLVGTTEVRQAVPGPTLASNQEILYLIDAYNHYSAAPVTENDISEVFAGTRPLVKSAADPSRATRESAVERQGRLINVFGGKWTTARALARRVHQFIEAT